MMDKVWHFPLSASHRFGVKSEPKPFRNCAIQESRRVPNPSWTESQQDGKGEEIILRSRFSGD